MLHRDLWATPSKQLEAAGIYPSVSQLHFASWIKLISHDRHASNSSSDFYYSMLSLRIRTLLRKRSRPYYKSSSIPLSWRETSDNFHIIFNWESKLFTESKAKKAILEGRSAGVAIADGREKEKEREKTKERIRGYRMSMRWNWALKANQWLALQYCG